MACASSVGFSMTIQAVLPSASAMRAEFAISEAAIAWLTLSYVLPQVVFTVPLAPLVGRFSRRWMFPCILVLYALAGLAQGRATSYDELLIFRFAQGVTSAAAAPIIIAIIVDAYRARDQVWAFGVRQTTTTTGELVLPLVGALLGALSWKGPFLAQAAMFGVAALAVAVLDDRGGASTWTLRPGSWKVIDRQPGGYVIMLIGFARFFFKFTLLAYLPILLIQRQDATLAQAGLVVACAGGAGALSASQVARTLQRIPASRLTAMASLLIGLSLVATLLAGDWRLALMAALVYGCGDGVLAVLQDGYLPRAWRHEAVSAVASVSQTARSVGKLFSPLLMSAIVAAASVSTALTFVAVLAVACAPLFVTLAPLDDRFKAYEGAVPRETLDI